MHIKLYEEWKSDSQKNYQNRLVNLLKWLNNKGYNVDKSQIVGIDKKFGQEIWKYPYSVRKRIIGSFEKLTRLKDFNFSFNKYSASYGLSQINIPNHSYTFEEKPDHFEDLPRFRDLVLYSLRFLLYADISVEGATAIIANLWKESYLNPYQKQFKGGPGRGITQWTDDERWSIYLNTFLPKFKAQNSITAKYNWYDLDSQLCYVMDELINGTYDYVYNELKTSGNLNNKTILVLQKYEVAGTRFDKKQQLQRCQLAEMIYNMAKSDPEIKYILMEVDLLKKLNRFVEA